LAIFRVRLASNPLQTDEYVSDKFASEKLRDTFHIEKPSKILESTLDELSKFQDKLDKSKNMKKTFFSDIKSALREYHPPVGLRVGNIIIRVDKK